MTTFLFDESLRRAIEDLVSYLLDDELEDFRDQVDSGNIPEDLIEEILMEADYSTASSWDMDKVLRVAEECSSRGYRHILGSVAVIRRNLEEGAMA